jgi:RNA polymerase sigma-70 factor, ECF subfamily
MVNPGPAQEDHDSRAMIDTSTSLLARLQSADQAQAWSRFVSLYTPMLFHWIRRQGVPASDAADLVQEVFAVLVTKLPTFHYDRARSFSAWLRTITTNKCRDYFRRRRAVAEVSAAAVDGEVPDHAELFSESEYRRGLARRALEVMQANFETHSQAGHQAITKQLEAMRKMLREAR